jgi:HemY protein
LSPHPDLAEVYAAARQGDAPRDRLKRLKILIKKAPGGDEGAIALARAGVDARDWRSARAAIAPLLTGHLSARICALMAEIEHGEFGDKGKVREWLARAVHAPRDPVWTADGVVSQNWLPVSPVTGELDRFEWKVPLEALGDMSGEVADEDAVRPASNGKALEDFVQDEDELEAVTLIEEQIAGSEEIAISEEHSDQAEKPEAEQVIVLDESGAPEADTEINEEVPAEERDVFVAPPPPDDPGPREAKRDVKQWLRSFWP